VRYLIWDFDNTLAIRPGMWSQCLADLANEMVPGACFSRQQFAPHLAVGFPWHAPEVAHPELSDPEEWWSNLYPVLASALAAGANMEPMRATAAISRIRDKYLTPETWHVYPDAEPALTTLTALGWSHIVLSNHVPELPQLISRLGLATHFRHILTSAALGYEKPHPAAFGAAVKFMPSGARVVMVGDSFVADYQGAKAAGLEAVLVRNTHPECHLALPDLHALVTHLDDA
jgi:putative hydrolase of the HAD superfamily